MSSILLDLSGKIDAAHRDALSLIKEIADSLNIPFFIVGASARDYLLEHYYGQSSPRRTLDIDLGVEVAAPETLQRMLLAIMHFECIIATPRPKMASGINTFRKDFGKKAGAGFLVQPGDVRLPLGQGVEALPFAEL